MSYGRRAGFMVSTRRGTVAPPIVRAQATLETAGPARIERAAGIVARDLTAPRPTSLPETADFSLAGDTPNAAYWMLDGSLYRASSAQVTRDVRAENFAAGGVNAWNVDLLERIATRVREWNSLRTGAEQLTIPAMQASGDVLSRQWLGLGLMTTYGTATTPRDSLRFPTYLLFPRLGQPFAAATGSVRVNLAFDPSSLALNPFRTDSLGFDVSGTRPTGSARKSNNGLLILAILAAYAASET